VTSKLVTALSWLLQIGLCVMFLFAGGAKLAGATAMVEMYDVIGWGQWFRYVTGLIEVGSALMLLVPAAAFYGALLLACTMVGAIIAHLAVLHVPFTGPIVLLVLCAGVLWLRRPGVVVTAVSA